MQPQKALVTGANGFIGSALTRRLLRDGIAVRAMCRTIEKGKPLADEGAEVVPGDIQDAAICRRWAEGCDVVFHVAAVGVGSAMLQYSVNVQGTRNVLRAAHEGGAKRFVHVSSVAIYGYGVNGPVDESHRQRPSKLDFYMRTKAMGERAVWRFAKRTGMPTVSVRPAFVYGPGSMLWSKALYDVCRRYAAVPLIAGGTGKAHPIYVDDVVDLLVTAAVHPAAAGNAFNAAPDPAVSWREFIGYYARMAGNSRMFSVPLPSNVILKPVGDAISILLHGIGRQNDVFGALAFTRSQAVFSMDKAARLLGWQPKISLEEGMARTERWLKSLD